MTDEAIIRRVLNGTTDDYAVLVRRYGGRVQAFIRRMVATREDAEDLTQETFLQAYRELRRYDAARAPFDRWLLHIAYTQTMMQLRKTIPIQAAADDLPDDEPTDDDRTEALQRAIERLSIDDQLLVNLYYRDDLPLRDIGYIVGHDAAYLATRLQRIRKKLYQIITEEEQ